MKTLSRTVFTFMAWLGLIGVSGAVTEVHAEDPFDGNRLFFTQAQRTQSTFIGSVVSPDSLPDALVLRPVDADAKDDSNPEASKEDGAKAGSVDPLNIPQHRLSTVRHETSANSYQVYFTGLVTGTRQFRVLVNGLPCESALAEHDAKSDQPVSIDCHGVRNDGLRLTLLTTSGELVVTNQAGRVHHLLPGEGM